MSDRRTDGGLRQRIFMNGLLIPMREWKDHGVVFAAKGPELLSNMGGN